MKNKPQITAQIEKLREALKMNETSLIDIFGYVAGYAETNPGIASSLLRHMSDVVQEHANEGIAEMDYSDILCDGIVRTFISGAIGNTYPGFDPIHDPSDAMAFLGDLTDHVVALQDPQVLATANAATHVAH